MSDEAAATPAPEAAPQPVTLVPNQSMSREQALQTVRGALKASSGEQAPQPAETTRETPPASGERDPNTGRFLPRTEQTAESEALEPEAEPEKAKPTETPSKETVSADQSDEVEVPDTLKGLAEQLGVDPEALLGHLRVEVKGENGEYESQTLAEIVRGTLRNKDYSEKTAKLADDRRQLDSLVSSATQALQAKHQQVDDLLTLLTGQLDTGPSDADLQAMLNPNDPRYDVDGYVRANALRQQRTQAIQHAVQTLNGERQQLTQQQQQQLAQFRQQQQQRLASWVPETADKAKLPVFEREVREYLTKDIHPGAVFTEKEVDSFFQTFDARQVLIIRDAIAFRKLQKGQATVTKTLKTLPRATRPNAPAPRGDNKQGIAEKSLQSMRRATQAGDKASAKAAALDYIRTKVR